MPGGGVYDAHFVSCGSTEQTVYFDVSAWGPDPEWRLKVYGGPAGSKGKAGCFGHFRRLPAA